MNIESPRFGTLQIEPGKIIDFPHGLAGFEDNRRFSLFHPEEQTPQSKYFILQSLDDPEIAFQITDPARLGFSYEIELNDEESALLKLTDPGEIAVAVIVWRDAEVDANPQGTLRASLKAPLLINTRERLGLQHVFTRLDCTLPNSNSNS
ncbi:Flagellar assembly factor FliW [Sterolibacterium denitrificans]|uniref:Flagellar assembly factor FliW n=1 Tax=Sterolibacterium denitrificans TaxID=157592 RepID=A0A7Z7MUI1_9PROT|nr:flagellar assembly protein FliW [Sterolibacterium denitrificans]SMB22823.1 Flagellar assembly factor FliW [Sterolibacterium denitrificans]